MGSQMYPNGVQNEGTLAISVHQQAQEQSQHQCPEWPALQVAWLSHPERVDQVPLEAASRFPFLTQLPEPETVPAVVLALPEAWPAALLDPEHVALPEKPSMAPFTAEESVSEVPWWWRDPVVDQNRADGAMLCLDLQKCWGAP